MTSSSDRQAVEWTSLPDMAKDLQPIGVVFYKVAGERGESTEDGGDDADVAIHTAYRLTDVGVDYRCRMDVTFGTTTVVVDAALQFGGDPDTDYTVRPELVAEFGSEVAIMILFPYLRQAVSDVGGRIGFETTLPLLPRGSITFEVAQSD